jgi:hypothetical protein
VVSQRLLGKIREQLDDIENGEDFEAERGWRKGDGLVGYEQQPAGRQLRTGFFFGGGETTSWDPSNALQRDEERCEERK